MRRKIRIVGEGKFPRWLAVLLILLLLGGMITGIIWGWTHLTEPRSKDPGLLVGAPFFSVPLEQDSDMSDWVRDNYTRIYLPQNVSTGAEEDGSTFFASAEMELGHLGELQVPIKNISEFGLAAELTLNVPESVRVEVWIDEDNTSLAKVKRLEANKWRFEVEAGADYEPDTLHIVIDFTDSALPGNYVLQGNIEQLRL